MHLSSFKLPLDLVRIKWARARGRPPPAFLLLLFDLTYRCNLRCRMCDAWRLRALDRSPELTFEQIDGALRDAASLGCRVVSFSGGEPLLREDLPRIVASVGRHRMSAHLDTNGTLLGRGIVEALSSSGLSSVNVSVDGACPETHDAVRGVPGSFSRTEAGIRALRRHAPRITVGINTVISRNNIDELLKIVDLARSLEVETLKFLPINFLPPYDLCGMQDRELALTEEDAPHLMDRVDQLILHLDRVGMYSNSVEYLRGMVDFVAGRTHFGTRCYAGDLWLYIDAFGEVLACTPVQSELGTLHEKALVDIWRSGELSQLRSRLRAGDCPGCWDSCYVEPSIRASFVHLAMNPGRTLQELRSLLPSGR